MRILVVKLSSMGDVVGALPAITEAHRALPTLQIDWVVEEHFAEIPSWHPAVQQVIPIAWRRWRKQLTNIATWRELKKFGSQLRTNQYDYILDAQGLIKSAVVACLARGVRCGFNRASAREPLASLGYQQRVITQRNDHIIERIRQLFATSLGYPSSSSGIASLNYGIDRWQGIAAWNSPTPYLIFAHGSSRNNKCWEELHWQGLITLANQAGLKVYLPWGNPLEHDRAQRWAEIATNCELIPPSTLTELRNFMQKAVGVIAVDTGLGHIAAALEIPTLSLFGPTDYRLGGAYGNHQLHLTQMHSLDAATVWQIAYPFFQDHRPA